MVSMIEDSKSPSGLWLKNRIIDGKSVKTRAGRLWNNLETRTQGRHKDKCYNDAVNGFGSFQEFAEWCQYQHGYTNTEDNGYFWQLDKDILIPGNKVYAPETCCFIPNKVNSLLTESKSLLGLPTGVSYSNNGCRFVARCRDLSGKRVHVGVYDCPEEAHWAWYEYKREVIKMILRKYDLSSAVVIALKTQWNI